MADYYDLKVIDGEIEKIKLYHDEESNLCATVLVTVEYRYVMFYFYGLKNRRELFKDLGFRRTTAFYEGTPIKLLVHGNYVVGYYNKLANSWRVRLDNGEAN